METRPIKGRPNRKLRGRADEIALWIKQGFSLADIHRFVMETDKDVSYEAVKREVRKLRSPVKSSVGQGFEPRTTAALSQVETQTTKTTEQAAAIAKGVDYFDELVAKGIGNKLLKRGKTE
jgi:DNA-binding transcriptional MerR regulator